MRWFEQVVSKTRHDLMQFHRPVMLKLKRNGFCTGIAVRLGRHILLLKEVTAWTQEIAARVLGNAEVLRLCLPYNEIPVSCSESEERSSGYTTVKRRTRL